MGRRCHGNAPGRLPAASDVTSGGAAPPLRGGGGGGGGGRRLLGVGSRCRRRLPLGPGPGSCRPHSSVRLGGAGGEAWRGQWPRSPGLGPVGPIELRGCVWGQGSRSLKEGGGGGRGLGPAAPLSHTAAPLTGLREVQGAGGDDAVLLRGAGDWPRAGVSSSGGLWGARACPCPGTGRGRAQLGRGLLAAPQGDAELTSTCVL